MVEAPSRMEKNEAPQSAPVVQGTRRLRPRDITFGDTIEEMSGLLNFYMETWFNVDEVFGTHICTDENNDTLNVYANYDIASGQVRGELELTLCRGDGEDIPLVYRLDEDERAALLEKMRDYCQKENGQSLEDYAASLRMEDAAEPQMMQGGADVMPEQKDLRMLAEAKDLRRQLHQIVDRRVDQFLLNLLCGEQAENLHQHGGTLHPLTAVSSTSLKGRKPDAVILPDGRVVEANTWKKAAAAILRDCDSDPVCHSRLMAMRDRVNGRFRSLVSAAPEGMGAPLEISEELYVEGKFDTDALLENITEKVLAPAGYDYRGVVIRCRPMEQTAENCGPDPAMDEAEEISGPM